jgi:hypothetical protein
MVQRHIRAIWTAPRIGNPSVITVRITYSAMEYYLRLGTVTLNGERHGFISFFE